MWGLIALADRKTVFDAAGLLLSIFKAGGSRLQLMRAVVSSAVLHSWLTSFDWLYEFAVMGGLSNVHGDQVAHL